MFPEERHKELEEAFGILPGEPADRVFPEELIVREVQTVAVVDTAVAVLLIGDRIVDKPEYRPEHLRRIVDKKP